MEKKTQTNKNETTEIGRSVQWNITPKQLEALNYLNDLITTEILYGGSAGNGKSYLGCAWLISCCFNYPGSRWLLGRSVMKQLKQSTLLTFFEVCRHWGLEKDKDYVYSPIDGIITIKQTDSQVFLKDLAYYPSDPEYDSLGSTEYTGAFIDEASQITAKAKNVVKSRLRYKIDEFKIIPKLLMTCNPAKNFLYLEFYKPSKEGKLEKGRAFIPALPGDNPYLPKQYIETLKSLDLVSKDRLLFGNWEYDSDTNSLIVYDSLIDAFTNSIEETKEKWCIVDVARFGSDKTVSSLWKGLEWYSVEVITKQDGQVIEDKIKAILRDEMIPYSHCIIDEDGIGGGVLDHIKGAKGFIAQRIAFPNKVTGKPDNFKNVKTQCAYYLSELINSHQIAITWVMDAYRNAFIEEAEQLKRADIDKEGKLAIEAKIKMKELLGRSPDLLDTAIMRMWFEFEKPTVSTIAINPITRLLNSHKTSNVKRGPTNYE
jgi:hypothetical protein